ncbi:mitochondrial genome maintenance MGM101-domain-containing protein [Xylariales sp. AK1849]|nr:mitochondrial genome maintenance MGM101-domain-containing protein [Xylariales sp. AK1849]
MASRATTPLHIASRQLRFFSRSSRSFTSASKAKTYPSSSAPRAAAATSTASKPSSSTSTSTASRTPPIAAKSTPARSANSSTSSPARQTPSAPTRRPIPPVSGQPLPDAPSTQPDASGAPLDWASSFHGIGTSTFGQEVAAVLQAPLEADDIEVKPDGIIYLPEIKYRRILNAAFGPGGWGLAPRADLVVQEHKVSRDYALIVHGRFVGQARGEMQYFNEDGISTAAEGCKSNALMRCCKDLGIASELWDPRFIRKFMKSHAQQVWVEHATTKKKKQIWLRKDDDVRYPFKKTS